MSINTVVLTGNLTRDPELRATPGGTAVCQLGLAVNERYKDASGSWSERPNYFDITVWGTQGENCSKYLSKGSKVAVDGRLRWESWEKDGQKRSKVGVVANRVEFLDPPQRDAGPDLPTPAVAAASGLGSESDDIPF